LGNALDVNNFRKPDYGIEPVFINRWSPRALSGEALNKEELYLLFEAARWAPSSYNNQPWRFLYAMRNTDPWNTFFNLMVEANQMWAKNAAALVVVISKKTFDFNGKPSITHTFDAGAAWQNIALQGSLRGLVVHGMQGFDYDRAKEVLHISDEFPRQW
jgi:nitroreductase